MSSLSFNPVGGYSVVVALAMILCLLLLVGPARSKTTSRHRRILAALRLSIFFMLLLTMLRPALVVTEVKKQSATLVMLIDRSRSMQVTDSFGGASRWTTLKSLLDAAVPQLAELADDLEVKVYTFDDDLYPKLFPEDQFEQVHLELSDMPDGKQSAIGWALDEVIRREAGKRLAGIVLLTDGAQRAYAPKDTPPQMAVRRLADLGFPLYTLAFGQARGLGQARDVALRDLITNQTVFVKNPLEVLGTVRVNGYAGKQVPVQLLFENAPEKMDVVGAVELSVYQDGQQLPVELSHIPQVPGEYKLTLKAAHQEGELVTTNNQLSTFVTVLKGGLNVLYLEGELRAEQRFVRSSLDASPNVKLDFEWIDKRTRDDWPFDLSAYFQPGKYDVVILGDLDSAALSREQWQALADRVWEGTGLLMMGGFHSFGPGGYHRTPLAKVLPLRMGRLERQRFEDPISADLHLPGPVKIRPSKLFGTHPIMHLAKGPENLVQWAKLPPLDGANRLRGLKRNAIVLAESDDANRAPLLVAASAGNGRVLAFAGDSTWHWALEGFEIAHKRFWRQVVLWLAKKDESTEGLVWIKLDPRRYRPGSRVEFLVGATSPTGEPVEAATFQVEILSPDGKRSKVRLIQRGNQMIGSFLDTLSSGDYTIFVRAEGDDGPLGSAQARFLVFEQDLELDNPAADPALLASLARLTEPFGGESLAPEELSDLLNRLLEKPLDLEVETQTKRTYWDSWPFLLVFITLLSTEWYLRKKWGLV